MWFVIGISGFMIGIRPFVIGITSFMIGITLFVIAIQAFMIGIQKNGRAPHHSMRGMAVLLCQFLSAVRAEFSAAHFFTAIRTEIRTFSAAGPGSGPC